MLPCPLKTMRQLIVKQLDYDLTPVAGLALVGHYLKWLAPVFKQIDAAWPNTVRLDKIDL